MYKLSSIVILDRSLTNYARTIDLRSSKAVARARKRRFFSRLIVKDAEGTYEMKKKKKKGITGWFKGAEKKKEGKKIELDWIARWTRSEREKKRIK